MLTLDARRLDAWLAREPDDDWGPLLDEPVDPDCTNHGLQVERAGEDVWVCAVCGYEVDPPAARVTTQSYQRPGRSERWSYVLHLPGGELFVSPYRYGSSGTALGAGEDELRATLALEALPC